MEARKELYESIAAGLLSRYNSIRNAAFGSELSGTSAENVLTKWMSSWMPTGISLKNAAAISVHSAPTNQLDCILFDNVVAPVFHNEGGIQLLPIEGIIGDIEINFGNSTTYAKIEKDCKKLTSLAEIFRDKINRQPILLSHIHPSRINDYSVEEAIDRSTFHVQFSIAKPLLLIFAEQINGTLEAAAERIMNHNKRVGIAKSIDGLFVLKQGFAKHLHPNGAGWNTMRMASFAFGSLRASEGRVLSQFQNTILQNLSLTGKSSTSFDRYITSEGQAERDLLNRILISDEEYQNQQDDSNVVPVNL